MCECWFCQMQLHHPEDHTNHIVREGLCGLCGHVEINKPVVVAQPAKRGLPTHGPHHNHWSRAERFERSIIGSLLIVIVYLIVTFGIVYGPVWLGKQ